MTNFEPQNIEGRNSIFIKGKRNGRAKRFDPSTFEIHY